jgi:hypothetical protein
MNRLTNSLISRLFHGAQNFLDTDESYVAYLPEMTETSDSGETFTLVVSNKALYIVRTPSLYRLRIPWEFIVDYRLQHGIFELAWLAEPFSGHLDDAIKHQYVFVISAVSTRLWQQFAQSIEEQIAGTIVYSQTVGLEGKYSLTMDVRPRAGRLLVSYSETDLKLKDLNPEEIETLKELMADVTQRMRAYVQQNQADFEFSARLPQWL